jgi:hypothetical protein
MENLIYLSKFKFLPVGHSSPPTVVSPPLSLSRKVKLPSRQGKSIAARKPAECQPLSFKTK